MKKKIMKSIIAICLGMLASFTLPAQKLNGTQEYSNPSQFGGNRYNIVNWEANYQVFIKGDAFMHRLSNLSALVRASRIIRSVCGE